MTKINMKEVSKEQYFEYVKSKILNQIDINENGCWIWKGYKCSPKKLYGFISLNDKMTLTHRASYILWKGEIPEGMYVLHDCDVTLCVNPDHLHIGSAQDNMNEMKGRGR